MTDAPTPVRYKPKPHVETIGGRALKPSTLMLGMTPPCPRVR
jgi:hypothetical protein